MHVRIICHSLLLAISHNLLVTLTNRFPIICWVSVTLTSLIWGADTIMSNSSSSPPPLFIFLDSLRSSTTNLGRQEKKGLLGIFQFSRRKSKVRLLSLLFLAICGIYTSSVFISLFHDFIFSIVIMYEDIC